MSLTALAFRRRAVTWLLTGLLLALGTGALFTLPRREDPDLSGRFGQIVALWPGADAAQTEALLAEPIERTLREVDDIGKVTTTARPGLAILQFEAADRMHGSLDKMMDDVRERIADLRPSLPAGVAGVEVNDRFSDTSALVVGIHRPGATPRELEEDAKLLRRRLLALPEVSEARLLGEREPVVRVLLSAGRLSAYGGAVRLDQVADALARRDVLPRAAGDAPAGDARLSLAATGAFRAPGDVAQVVVASPGGVPVHLRDVGRVQTGYADPPGFLVRIDGQPAVVVSVAMRKGRNIARLGEAVRPVLEATRASLAPGTRLTVVNDLPRSVARRVGEFFHELLVAVGIVFVVMVAFMGLRSALLVGVLLPATMLGTFAAMAAAGRDIQQMSIAALIIALALVVDNTIVVLDNVEERMAGGMAPEAAAVAGADEMRGPFLTANLVAVTSFLPLAFLPGGAGDFVRDLGVVTALSLAVSVALNLTVTPLLCARFLRPTRQGRRGPVQRWLDRGVDRLRDGKAGLAESALRRPRIVLAITAVALAGALSLIPRLGIAFFPPAERDQFVVDVWLPEGRGIRATGRVVSQVEAILAESEGVRSVASYIGRGGPRFYYNVSPEPPTPHHAQIVVNTRDLEVTERLVRRVQALATARIAGARVTVRKLEQGPPVGAPVAVRLSGEKIADLRAAGARVRALLERMDAVHSVHDSYGETPLRLGVHVDEERAAAAGLSRAQIAATSRLAFSGATVGVWRDGDREVPVELRMDRAERESPGAAGDLHLPGGARLRDVATFVLEPEPVRIVRRDGVRTLTVYAFVREGVLPSAVTDAVRAALSREVLPAGVTVAFGGESEEAGKSFGDMAVVFGIAVVVNVVLLVLQFGSAPVVAAILSAVPLGVIGAVPGLFLTRQHFGFMAFLGIAALGGIVTNHTIFLFHYALEERRRGVPMATALVDASRRRLRPILLTVLLSVGALLPQALSGSRLWPPLDWAIVSGLLVSTFLSMVVVPCVYAVLDRREMRAVAEPGG